MEYSGRRCLRGRFKAQGAGLVLDVGAEHALNPKPQTVRLLESRKAHKPNCYCQWSGDPARLKASKTHFFSRHLCASRKRNG